MSNQAVDISILRFPENVRRKKEMYLNDPNHCLQEIVDNAIDEHSAGHGNAIAVAIVGDVATVQDQGRGLPINAHKDPEYKGQSQAEVAYTVLHSGGKFGQANSYKTASAGTHGVGGSCVNAVSESLNLEICTDGSKYRIEFEKGFTTSQLKKIEDNIETTGTSVSFKLDKEIWGEDSFDHKKIENRIRQLAYLNPGLTFYLFFDTTDSDGKEVKLEKIFCYPGGIKDYILKLSKGKAAISDIAYFTKKIKNDIVGEVELSFALIYTDSYSQDFYSFVNNVSTDNGGDHLVGMKNGISRAVKKYMIEKDIIKDPKEIENDDTREGVISIISVKVMEPRFEGQGKSKIKMPEIQTIVRQESEAYFYDLLNQDDNKSSKIIDKVMEAAKARKAAAKARDAVRGSKNAMDNSKPEKLADCSEKDPALSEIFIVEGDSAAGSAKMGRDRLIQAILPVFGKVLNVEKSRVDKVITNPKLLEMVKAFKCGIGEFFDITKLRYHKIILMADSDSDGGHIQCLNLTFLYRYLRPLIEAGYVYIACPPLFKVSKKTGKKEEITYLHTKEELELFDTEGCLIQRYKGWSDLLALITFSAYQRGYYLFNS